MRAWLGCAALLLAARPAAATDWTLFPATDNVTAALVSQINAETVRIDMSAWYLTEHAISIALVNRFHAGVPVRVVGDRVSIFESDPLTRREFYWLASQGIPIRLRYFPTWQPEIVHWKATIFAGLARVSFGSANYTPFELAPASATDFKDEVVTITDDPSIVNAFRTRFDRMWNDSTAEPGASGGPPYFLDWSQACIREPSCADYPQLYPSPHPMTIDPRRLEPDYASPADLIWSQGPEFNRRVVAEIAREPTRVDLVIYRLTDPTITDALIQKHQQGVAVRVIVEPEQYTSRVWPEYWLTHANVDRLWMAGIAIRRRAHAGLTHMKVLVTSSYATNASSNFTTNWQRDHNWFVAAATHPDAYHAIRSRFEAMWNDTVAFAPFAPGPADSPTLTSPAQTTPVGHGVSLMWQRTPFATSYDVYFGPAPDRLSLVATVPAVLTLALPETYVWSPAIVQSRTQYAWRIVARTLTGLATSSPVRTFETALWQRPADIDGDGLTDLSVWRPSTGVWWTKTRGTGAVGATSWGASSDRPVPADYDADGRTDLAVFRPGTGTWHIVYSSSGGTAALPWGNAADRPVPADYDGDGRADLAVFRPAEGTWYIVTSSTNAVSRVQWGAPGDRPLPADYDGDGKADVAVFRPADGTWYLLYSRSRAVWAGLLWGNALDVPVPGDYDGDGRTDLAVYRPSTGWWYISTATGATLSAGWGLSTDVPLPVRP